MPILPSFSYMQAFSKSWRSHNLEHPLSYTGFRLRAYLSAQHPGVIIHPHLAQLHWPRITVHLHFSKQISEILPIFYNTHMLIHTILGTKLICLCILYNYVSGTWQVLSRVLNEWIPSLLLEFTSIRYKPPNFRYFFFYRR